MALSIKICGLRTEETVDTALEYGADMVGFVFFGPSPRNLSLLDGRLLGERIKNRALKVALTVDAGAKELQDIVDVLKPDMLQLHGTETPEQVALIRSKFGLP